MENIVMKKLLITTTLAVSLTSVSVQASPSIMQDDMNQIFSIGSTGGSFPVGAGKQSHQVAMLSKKERTETEGEAWWLIPMAFSALGSMGGGGAYLATNPHYATGYGLAHSMAWGAVAGGTGALGGIGWGLFGIGGGMLQTYSSTWR
jgi:hypothetical protein